MNDPLANSIRQRLQNHHQEHLLGWQDELTPDAFDVLLRQVDTIDFDLIDTLFKSRHAGAQSSAIDGPSERAKRAKPPSQLVRLPMTPSDQDAWAVAVRAGKQMLAAGKVGVILVAGGQGTRLGFPHPKGMYPIGPVSDSSLFQILAEQSIARAQQAKTVIPYFIMTSETTHSDTVNFFEKHAHFGLNADDVRFFQQANMPAVDAETGRLILSEKGKLATSPDGHGGMLTAMANAGLLEEMRSRGVEYLYYHQVDNPTSIVCDPALLGFHFTSGSEMTTKVATKRTADEKMGIVVDIDGRTQILEYSDLPDDVARQTDEAGDLLLSAGNMAIHVFNRTFLERLLSDEGGLPFHLAKKAVPFINNSGELVDPNEPNAYKFERFIFDALPHAAKALVVEADRSLEFNPVKNNEGKDSPDAVKAAMMAIHRDWLEAAGADVADGMPVEISPLFALDADGVANKISPGTRYTRPVYLK